MKDLYVIGVDYGSDSVRSLVVNAASGEELASSVFYYPRWKKGLYCDAGINQFRQHPLDYIEGLESTIKSCLAQVDAEVAQQVVAISVDTTGSTPVAVDRSGTPLALKADFAENPNAMFVLWKDHTGVGEAQEINDAAAKSTADYLKYVGGVYSSEWFWSKALHVYREDKEVKDNTYTWIEHCDWIPFLLTGGDDVSQIKRSVCAAGHKGLWAEEFGGYPPNDFFVGIDPLLSGLVDTLGTEAYDASVSVGNLSEEWATRLGLTTAVKIGVGAFDAHMGAVGGQIEPYHLSKVMGTSTCDILVAPGKLGTDVKGICGQVNGSVIPGMVGLEAGQSAFGDSYAWFKNILMWPINNLVDLTEEQQQKAEGELIAKLSVAASEVKPEVRHPFALDWLNGRRTPYANQNLKAAIFGLNLSTDTLLLYRAIVESTCFGAKKIVDCFVSQGIPVEGIIGLGGVARKSSFVMQMMADILNKPIRIHKSEQTCALGAAMFAATVAGLYATVEDAMQAMGSGFDMEYFPIAENAAVYAKRYEKYLEFGELVENNN